MKEYNDIPDSEMIVDGQNITRSEVSLAELFLVFLKIGALSFGGHMSVIAFVEKTLVEDKKWLTSDQLLNAVSLISVFPGPFFVNIVAYFGYILRGWIGGLISLLAVVLPASILMVLFAMLYLGKAYLFDFKTGIDILLVTVAALILSTGVTLFQKQIKIKFWDLLFFGISIVVAMLLKEQIFILLLMLLAGARGYITYTHNKKDRTPLSKFVVHNISNWFIFGGLGIVLLLYLMAIYTWPIGVYPKLATLFSGMSLTLFGGGFVIIPYMQNLLVDSLHWISPQEFIYAITLGQITPGPLLVSTTFVGYKLGGLPGALVATLSIFGPSALFTVATVRSLKQTDTMGAILKGIQPVVVGLIISSGLQLIRDLHDYSWYIVGVGVLAFLLLFRYKANAAYVLSAAMVLGLIVRLIFQS